MAGKLFSLGKIFFIKYHAASNRESINQAKIIELYPGKFKKKKKLAWFHF